MNESFLAILAVSAKLRRMKQAGLASGFLGMATVALGLAAAFGMGCSFSGDDGDGDSPDAGETETPRWPSGHLFRKAISVTPADGESISGFMLGVFSGADAELAAAAKSDGADLLLTDASDVALPFELEYFDNVTGAFALWTPVTLSDQQLFLYYGSDEDVVQETNVWPVSMRGVWHSRTDNSDVVDSSINKLTAVPTPSGPTATEFGPVGDVLSFRDDSPRLAVSNSEMLSFGTSSFTYSAWVFVESIGHDPDEQAWHFGGTDNAPGYALELGSGQWSATVSDDVNGSASANFGTLSAVSDQWVHLAAVVDQSSAPPELRSYLNGVFVNATTLELGVDLSPGAGVVAHLGGELNNRFIGNLDEVRVMAGALGAPRLLAQHANLTDPGFFAIGEQESAPTN